MLSSGRLARFATWALSAVLLFAAAPAGAQVLQISSAGSSFGPADCDDGSWGTSTGHTDTAINLTYQYSTVTTELAGSQKVQLFATRQSCPAVPSNSSSVTMPSDAISMVAAGTAADANSHTANVKVSQLAAPAGGCATPQTTTWNVCFYEFYQPQITFPGQSTDYQSASATVTLSYDSQAPGAPRLDAVTPGDQHLRVSYTSPGDSDIQSFEVLVAVSASTPQSLPMPRVTSGSSGSTGSAGSTSTSSSGSSSSSSTGSTGSSGSTSSSGSTGSTGSTGSSGSSSSSSSGSSTGGFTATACINGSVLATLASSDTEGLVPSDSKLLVNGTSYDVQIRAIDQSGNVGACSNVISGTPQQIDDFWRLYKKDGGSGAGGCAQAGGGVAFLALLGAIVLLGRARKEKR